MKHGIRFLSICLAATVGWSWPLDGWAGRCVDFRGLFDASVSGLIRCEAEGESASQPFSAFGTTRVSQRGCSIRFVPPSGDVSSGSLRGTIRGRSIRLKKPAPPSIPDFDIDSFEFQGSGRIARSRNRATIRISIRIEGEFQGVDVTCTARATTRLVRSPAATAHRSGEHRRAVTPGSTVLSLLDGVSVAIMAVRAGVPGAEWRFAGAGDFDGDGRADLVWRHPGTGEHEGWLSDPTGPARFSFDREPDPAWHLREIADLDGDGQSDIVWRNALDGAGEAWLMDGPVARERLSLPSLDAPAPAEP